MCSLLEDMTAVFKVGVYLTADILVRCFNSFCRHNFIFGFIWRHLGDISVLEIDITCLPYKRSTNIAAHKVKVKDTVKE